MKRENAPSMVRAVQNRQLLVPGVRNEYYQSQAFQKYGEERYQLRARFDPDEEGTTFAIKFAESSDDKQFCLLTHASRTHIWEMSGVYTRRRPKELHAAKLVETQAKHTDGVSCVAWMPSAFSVSYDSAEYAKSLKGSNESSYITLPPYFTSGFDKTIKMFKKGQIVGDLGEYNDWVRFMDVNASGTHLATGSVSTRIHGWNTETLKAEWQITPAHETPSHLLDTLQGLNSINGLQWMHGSSTIFASGAGDGSIKLWDTRALDLNSTPQSCVGTVVAHTDKLNNLQWMKDNRFMITSGRDDAIRLLDMRMLRNDADHLCGPPNQTWHLDRLIVKEYRGHSCNGYNIQAALFENDTRICTGSRDGKIYVYDVWSGKRITEIAETAQPSHLVVPLPAACGPGLVSATISSCTISVWAPYSTTENTPESNLVVAHEMDEEAIFERARQEALENTIQQFGGQRFIRVLRGEGQTAGTFFDEETRAAFGRYLRDALRRLMPRLNEAAPPAPHAPPASPSPSYHVNPNPHGSHS